MNWMIEYMQYIFFLEFFIGVFYIDEEFYSSIIVSENNEIIPHNKQMI